MPNRELGRAVPWRWLALAAGVVIADQITKALVLAFIAPGERIALTAFLSLILAFNAGAAFSFLAGAGGWQRFFFIAVAAAASLLIAHLLRKHAGDRMFSFGLALILGGAIGNLIDRIRIEKVVDFVLVHDYLPFTHALLAWLDPFPAFNVADSAITCGAVALVIDSFRSRADPVPRAGAGRDS